MRLRLALLVSVPMLGALVLGTLEVGQQTTTLARARAVDQRVQRLQGLLEVKLQLSNELFSIGALAVGAKAGIDTKQMSVLLGEDLPVRVAATRRRTNAAFDGLRADDPIMGYRSRIDDVRQALDADLLALDRVFAELNRVDRGFADHADRAMRDAVRRARSLGGSTLLQERLDVLDAAHAAAASVARQLQAFGRLVRGDDYSVPEALGLHREAEHVLVEAAAQLDQADESVTEHWAAAQALPAVGRARQAAVRLSVVEPSMWDGGTRAQVAGQFKDAMVQLAAYHDVAGHAADAARAEGSALRAETLRGRTLILSGVVSLLALSVLLAAAVAKAIAQPLRQLAEGAAKLSAGKLDGIALPFDGPDEVRRVTGTMREVITNLQAVEAQLGALADGALDDPCLGTPVPGRLGELLHDSMASLSSSIASQADLHRQLEHEATHDALTGLPNRAAARSALGAALQQAPDRVAVLFIDLDDFKRINDGYGHLAGDRVLGVTAARLQAVIGTRGIVARMGGDEFVVVAFDVDDAAAAMTLGAQLVAAVSDGIHIGRGVGHVGASVGVALARPNAEVLLGPDAILRMADLAAYRAKSLGRGRVELFDDSLRTQVLHHADIEQSLELAMRDGELELHYQPVVDTAGRVRSVEALIRWNRPGIGLVLPSEFIPVAEGSDLIIDVGRWVLREACERLVVWAADPVLGDLSVSVNLSGRHLMHPWVVKDVRHALELTGADPSRLIVEITETVVVTDLPSVADHLRQLRALGVRVAIDDFGTGYTSLAHLTSLPADIIKIDQSLIRSEHERGQAHVLRLVVEAARALGMTLTAEGIETMAQLDFVTGLGCDDVQGYLFSRPVREEALRGLLAEWQPPRWAVEVSASATSWWASS